MAASVSGIARTHARVESWCGDRRVFGALAAVLVASFLVLGLVHVHPFVDDITVENDREDDWLDYKLNAISILEGGLHIPRVEGAYFIPGGFLYNYFVAAVFLIAGRNSAYVYVIQFGFLALAAVLMAILARRFMSAVLATGYMLVAAVFLLVTFWYWVIRLLSENLAIVLYPIVLILIAGAFEKKSLKHLAAAGFLAGLVVLTRPNLIGLPLLLAPLAFWSAAGLYRRVAAFGVFSSFAAASLLALPSRNLYVTQEWLSSGYGNLLFALPSAEHAATLARRLAFCAGILIGGWDQQGTEIVINKSWLLVTSAALASLVYLAIRRRLKVIDAACVLMIGAAYGPFLVLPGLGGYGFRFQHPYGPLLLFLVFRAAHELLSRVGRKS